jgi:hypothetical protein
MLKFTGHFTYLVFSAITSLWHICWVDVLIFHVLLFGVVYLA